MLDFTSIIQLLIEVRVYFNHTTIDRG